MSKEGIKIVWFAASRDIECMGPYNTDVEAWASLKSVLPGQVHVEGARVWPELVKGASDD